MQRVFCLSVPYSLIAMLLKPGIALTGSFGKRKE